MESRAEWGLRMLGQDIYNWLQGKPLRKLNDSNDIGAKSEGAPFVQNIINNYTNRTESPVQMRKFNFIDVFKIAFCIMVIVIVAKILLEPMWFVYGFNSWIQFFHSF